MMRWKRKTIKYMLIRERRNIRGSNAKLCASHSYSSFAISEDITLFDEFCCVVLVIKKSPDELCYSACKYSQNDNY